MVDPWWSWCILGTRISEEEMAGSVYRAEIKANILANHGYLTRFCRPKLGFRFVPMNEEKYTQYIYIIQIYTIYIYKTQPWKTCRNIGPNKWHVKYCNWYEMHKGVTKKSMVPGTRLWWPPAQCSRWCPALPSWACPATIGCRAGGGKCCGCCSWIGLGNFSWNLHSLWFRRFFMFLRHQISTENDQENYRWVTTYTLYHFIRWHTFWIPNDLYICCKISG